MPELASDEITQLVAKFYSIVLAHDNDARLASDEPESDRRRQSRVSYYHSVAERARTDLASNAFASVRAVSFGLLSRRFGDDAIFDETSIRRLEQALLRASSDLAEALKARAEGDFNYVPKDTALKAALMSAVSAPSPSPSPQILPHRQAPAERSFSEQADTFRQAQLRRVVWEKQTAIQARKTYDLFHEHFGDRPLESFTRADAAVFKALLEDLPASYGKAAEFRGKKASDIVAACAGRSQQRLSARTIQRHFSSFSALWESAAERDTSLQNIFDGWKFAAAKRARDQRQMWSKDELASLLQTPIWRGCQSHSRRSAPGSLILRDEKFWLPLIALHSGMRQEEICQLRADDLRTAEGVWVFDVNAHDGQQLKNANAVRIVPVHIELIRLGFIEYVRRHQSAGSKMLFPGLKPGDADNRYGHNYSKWFTRYRRDVQLYVSGRDFHSFRHSATTFMARAGVQATTIDQVTGHATTGKTARYNKGLTIANLKDAIDKIDLGIDFSYLHVAKS